MSLVLAGLAITGLAVGSVGFTGVSATREVSIAVAGNEAAYFGVSATVAGNTGMTEVVVENRFDDTITVERIVPGELTDSHATHRKAGERVHTEITQGESQHISVSFEADYVTVVISGEGITAHVQARVEDA
jgi:hypothetical protein